MESFQLEGLLKVAEGGEKLRFLVRLLVIGMILLAS